MDPLEFEKYPPHEKIRVELIGKSYAAARIVAVVIESATSTAFSGLNGPLPRFTDLIMSICKSDDRCMVMTSLMYLHGTLRLMRRYGIPFSFDSKRPMRQLTSNLLKEGCINELMDQYQDQFEFLSMELAEEEREDFFFRAMPNGLAADLPAFRTEDDCFPNVLPRNRWEVVGIKGLECLADFCMSMAVNRAFQDWVLQYRDLNREDYRRTQCPQIIKLVHDHIHRLKRGRAIHLDVLYPRLIPVNSFNNRTLYNAGVTLPAVLLDWTLEVTPEEHFRITVPFPPPSVGVRSRYAPTPIPRGNHQGDREQSVRPKDPMRSNPRAPKRYQDFATGSIRDCPSSNDPWGSPAPPRTISPEITMHSDQPGASYRHRVPVGSQPRRPRENRPITTPANTQVWPQDARGYGLTGTNDKETETRHTVLYQNTEKGRKKISGEFVQGALFDAIQALNQEVSKPTMTEPNRDDIIDPLYYQVLLAKAREHSITTKFEKERKDLTDKFEQKINGLQQELLLHQRRRLNTNEAVMIQTLQERGLTFNSCTRCLTLMQPCPHARPVELTTRPTRNRNNAEIDRHPGVPTFQPELTVLAEEPAEEPVLAQILQTVLNVVDEGPQDVMDQENSESTEQGHRGNTNEIRVRSPTTDNPPSLVEAHENPAPQGLQNRVTMEDAPHSDSDSEGPPEPNIVWSCQAVHWEDNRDLHGPTR